MLEETGPGKHKSSITVRVQAIALPLPAEGTVRAFVTVVKANNLRAADWGGKSDPYTVVEVPGKPTSKFTTRILFKDVNPVWDEEDEVRGYEAGDDLDFEVFDYDALSADDSLGKVSMQSSDFYPNGYYGDLSLGQGTLTV